MLPDLLQITYIIKMYHVFLSSVWLHNHLNVMRSRVVLLLFSDCMISNGVEYRGEQQSSSSGLTCLNWTNTSTDYDATLHPDSQTGKQLVF